MKLANGERLLAWPLKSHVLTAAWKYNDGSAHNAIDMRAAVGTPVYAAEDGTVNFLYKWNGRVTKGDTNSYGNCLKIKHAAYGIRSLETLYAHLSSIVVKSGEKVKEGQLIGYSGATGNCQGAHLHYEVRLGGKRVNPLCWHDATFTIAKEYEKNMAKYLFNPGEKSVVNPALAKPVAPAPVVEAKPVNVWDTNGPFVIAGATGNDKKALKELCEKLGFKVTAG